jgi:hypothetical protein
LQLCRGRQFPVPRRGWLGFGSVPAGPIVQNEAKLAGPAPRPGPRRAKCAERTQFGPRGQALAGPNVRNEPNLGRGAGTGGTKRAKRTQFWRNLKFQVRSWETRRTAGPGADCAKRSQVSRARAEAGAPEGEMCKTNPISRLRIADWRQTCRFRPAQADCAKRTQFRRSLKCRASSVKLESPADCWPRDRLCKTNPICFGQTGKTIAKAGGLDAATCCWGNCAKRTQFPAGWPERRWTRTGPWALRGRLAEFDRG